MCEPFVPVSGGAGVRFVGSREEGGGLRVTERILDDRRSPQRILETIHQDLLRLQYLIYSNIMSINSEISLR